MKGKSLLLQEAISSADPHTVFGNSHQQGRTPSNAPGTSSIRKTPLRQTEEIGRADIPYNISDSSTLCTTIQPLKALVCFKQTMLDNHF